MQINGLIRLGVIATLAYTFIEILVPYQASIKEISSEAIAKAYRAQSTCNAVAEVFPNRFSSKQEADAACNGDFEAKVLANKAELKELQTNIVTGKLINIFYGWLFCIATYFSFLWVKQGFRK